MDLSASTTISHLCYTFQSQQGTLEVLRDVSLHVGPGEVLSILGPSGCGKSTLLRCIAGLIETSDGTISVAGMGPSEALANKAIGFAFQDPGLLPWRTVEQNILLPLELGSGNARHTPRTDGLDRLLSLMGLTAFRNYLPDQLSGGMKQRTSLARALLLKSMILLLDEPLGSLDLLTRLRLSAELSRVIHTTTVPAIVVTHSVEEAVFLGTRVIVLSERPAEIVEEIRSDFPLPRDIPLMDEPRFLEIAAHCRTLLFQNWKPR